MDTEIPSDALNAKELIEAIQSLNANDEQMSLPIQIITSETDGYVGGVYIEGGHIRIHIHGPYL